MELTFKAKLEAPCSLIYEKLAKLPNTDRDDVIDHALDIFQFISEHLGVQKIASTKWGISDSIAIKLFHELYSSKVTIS